MNDSYPDSRTVKILDHDDYEAKKKEGNRDQKSIHH